jgi:uncharacterized protein (UPF0335 family)
MQAKEIVNKMLNLFDQIGVLNDDMKELKKEAKSSGFDAGILATIASAMSKGKSGALKGKYAETLELFDKLDD